MKCANLMELSSMAGEGVGFGSHGNYCQVRPQESSRRTRRASGADKRPPAVLITFDFNTNDNRESPYREELIKYLEETLGGVMVTQSSYAVPYSGAVIDIIAKIGQITHDSITAYAFPVQNWYGHGNAIADEWFQRHELPSLP